MLTASAVVYYSAAVRAEEHQFTFCMSSAAVSLARQLFRLKIFENHTCTNTSNVVSNPVGHKLLFRKQQLTKLF
jgi:hypothetical protein